MSKYIDQTVLLAYQADGAVEKERFATQFGIRAAIMNDTERLPWLTPRLRAYLNSVEGRDVRVPAIKKGSISAATVLSYNLPLNLPETDYTTLTLNYLMVSFGMYPEDFTNQQVSSDEIKRNRIMECDEALALALENLVDTHIGTYKTQVFDGSDIYDEFTFDAATDTLQVSKDGQLDDTMFSTIRTLAAYNNWRADGSYLVANPLIGRVYDRIRQYGPANQKNLLAQSLPEMYSSLRVTNTTGMAWTAYLIESGSIGIVPNYTLPFRIAKEVQGGQFDISAGSMPMLGDRVGLYEEPGEKASSQNANMSWVDKYAFVYSFFLLKRYNSDATTQVGNILKIDGKKV
jgi:hypothetical protein